MHEPNLLAARLQMAFTLGFHIVLACFGVGFPVLMLLAEGLGLRSGDPLWRTLARRWSRVFLVLFAVGAVSGTVLSFELGLLWPSFMETWGAVIGMPFTMEGFAFFLEAIFAGIYLYGWNRLSPRVHWLTGFPIAIAGCLSAFFVVQANAWMNTPAGFRWVDGKATEIDPLRAMWTPSAGPEITHMILSAYIVSGFCAAAFYASKLLRHRDVEYCRRGFSLGLLLALPLVPLQLVVGDWAAKNVARTQPTKFAAMEALFESRSRAPLALGGIPDMTAKELKYAVEIPGLLSWMAFGDTNARILGLNEWPPADTPPVIVVHVAFQVMVGIGSLMLLVAAWGILSAIRYRAWPTGRRFQMAVLALGPLSIVAMEAGWIVTEVGRQPWIVQGYMRTAEAVTHSSGVWNLLAVTLTIYFVIGVTTITILRRLAAMPHTSSAGQEPSHGA